MKKSTKINRTHHKQIQIQKNICDNFFMNNTAFNNQNSLKCIINL